MMKTQGKRLLPTKNCWGIRRGMEHILTSPQKKKKLDILFLVSKTVILLNFCCLSHPLCGTLLRQPQKSNIHILSCLILTLWNCIISILHLDKLRIKKVKSQWERLRFKLLILKTMFFEYNIFFPSILTEYSQNLFSKCLKPI